MHSLKYISYHFKHCHELPTKITIALSTLAAIPVQNGKIDDPSTLLSCFEFSDQLFGYCRSQVWPGSLLIHILGNTTWTSGNFFLLIKFYPYLCLVSKEEAKEDKVWTFFQKLFTVLKFLLGTLLNFLWKTLLEFYLTSLGSLQAIF